MNKLPMIQFVMRPLWQRILIALWPPYERARREEDQRVFEGVTREWRAAGRRHDRT